MSKYVKEMMMDQLRTDLDGSRSVLIVDLKGLDAVAEHQLPQRPAQEVDPAARAEEHAGPAGLHRHGDGGPLAVPGGPARWPSGAGTGVAELAKEISAQVKKLKKPVIKGGAVDGIVIGPDQVEDITKLPSREALIARVAALALSPAQRIVSLANAPAAGLMGQLKTMAEPADGEASPERRRPGRRRLSRNPSI